MDQPTADRPLIHIDDREVRALGPRMTGIELLSLAGADAQRFDLYAEGHHGRRIAPEQVVPVQDGGRFRTVRRV